MIKIITFTGADESVEPQELLDLYYKYPFAEFGILVSRQSTGRSARYPSISWINRLRACKLLEPDFKLALHICGAYVREILNGNISHFLKETGDLITVVDRIQLNINGTRALEDYKPMIKNLDWIKDKTFIFQHNRGSFGPALALDSAGFNAKVLFDASGGTGTIPDNWPAQLPFFECGYAGGIGPDNIEKVLIDIEGLTGPLVNTWLDMETNIRSNMDVIFDLKKVETVCRAATEFF